MSEWYEASDEDINIKESSEEVDILVTDNDWGNVYVTLTFGQIQDIYNSIEDLL